jgi:hypothetical protein
MSASGQTEKSGRAPGMSDLPLEADIVRRAQVAMLRFSRSSPVTEFFSMARDCGERAKKEPKILGDRPSH